MEILKFENSPRPARKKSSSLKAILGLAGIAAVALLGSTLAANISLNSGSAVEFGQGVAVTAACDSDGITATPSASFVNAASAGSFNFSTVAFSNVMSACWGKTFTLKAYGDTSATPLTIATSGATGYTSATFTFTTASTTSPAITTSSWTAGATNSQLTIGLGGTQATSGAVYKLTLESQ